MLKRLLVATAAAGAILIGPFASSARAESVPVPVIGCDDSGKCSTGVCWADLENGGEHTHCRTMKDFNDGNTGDPNSSPSANGVDRLEFQSTVELKDAFAIYLGYRHHEAEPESTPSSGTDDDSVPGQPDPADSVPDDEPQQPDDDPQQPDGEPEPVHPGAGVPQLTPTGSHDLSAEQRPAEFQVGGEIPILISQ